MRRAGGYAVIEAPDGGRVNFDRFRVDTLSVGTHEIDTFSCCHCNRIIHVKPFAPMDDFGSMCRNCMKMTCPTCAAGPCVPFEKRLEEVEKRGIALRSYGF